MPCSIVGHRGASQAFPENTLAAFQGAVDQGADGVELDVRRTVDGALAISHDDTLADGTVVVETAFADLPAEIPDLAAGPGRVPPSGRGQHRDQELAGRQGLRPHRSTSPLRSCALLDDPRRAGRRAQPHLLRSTSRRSTGCTTLAPSLATAWLVGMVEDAGRLIDRAAAHGHVAIHPHHAFVTEDLVGQAHAAGLAVNTWTCDDPDRIRWLAELGVDAVVTNVPDVALAALGR